MFNTLPYHVPFNKTAFPRIDLLHKSCHTEKCAFTLNQMGKNRTQSERFNGSSIIHGVTSCHHNQIRIYSGVASYGLRSWGLSRILQRGDFGTSIDGYLTYKEIQYQYFACSQFARNNSTAAWNFVHFTQTSAL